MIPKRELRTRLATLRKLMRAKHLGAILFYGHPSEDFEYLRWLTGIPAHHANYALVTDKGFFITEVRWRALERQRSSPIAKIVPCAGELDMIEKVGNILGRSKKVGIVGRAPYNEVVKLGASHVDVTRDIEAIMAIKTEWEAKQIKEACALAELALRKNPPKAGMSERELSVKIRDFIELKGSSTKGEISVVAGKRLAVTDFGPPTNYRIKRGDIVCIDLGADINGYNSDVTRCFVVGRNEQYRHYITLSKVQETIISKLKPGIISRDILKMYMKELGKYGIAKFLVPVDLGHGLGCGYHEPPSIGEDDAVLKAGMVFTLEPGLNTGRVNVRKEDVVLLTKDGAKRLS